VERAHPHDEGFTYRDVLFTPLCQNVSTIDGALPALPANAMQPAGQSKEGTMEDAGTAEYADYIEGGGEPQLFKNSIDNLFDLWWKSKAPEAAVAERITERENQLTNGSKLCNPARETRSRRPSPPQPSRTTKSNRSTSGPAGNRTFLSGGGRSWRRWQSSNKNTH